MRAGVLNKRVTLETPNPQTQDSDSGATINNWSTVVQMWARIEPLSGKEPYIVQQFEGKVMHKVTIRSNSLSVTATPKMRITYAGRIFNIKSVLNIEERGKELIFVVEEVV